jgi:hypothetical protein
MGTLEERARRVALVVTLGAAVEDDGLDALTQLHDLVAERGVGQPQVARALPGVSKTRMLAASSVPEFRMLPRFSSTVAGQTQRRGQAPRHDGVLRRLVEVRELQTHTVV